MITPTDQKREVQLADGTVLMVGDRQYGAIAELSRALTAVALGDVHSLSLVVIDGAGKARKALTTISGEGLDQLADALLEQSKVARYAATTWQGTVPPAARSFMEH